MTSRYSLLVRAPGGPDGKSIDIDDAAEAAIVYRALMRSGYHVFVVGQIDAMPALSALLEVMEKEPTP